MVALALAMKESASWSKTLIELGFGKEFEEVPLYIDIPETLHVIGNRAHSFRTNTYTALPFFGIRELVKEGRLQTTRGSTRRHQYKALQQTTSSAMLNMMKNSGGQNQRRQWCACVHCLCGFKSDISFTTTLARSIFGFASSLIRRAV